MWGTLVKTRILLPSLALVGSGTTSPRKATPPSKAFPPSTSHPIVPLIDKLNLAAPTRQRLQTRVKKEGSTSNQSRKNLSSFNRMRIKRTKRKKSRVKKRTTALLIKIARTTKTRNYSTKKIQFTTLLIWESRLYLFPAANICNPKTKARERLICVR